LQTLVNSYVIIAPAGTACSTSIVKHVTRNGKRPKGANGKRTTTSNGSHSTTATTTTDNSNNSSTVVDDDSLLYTVEDRINDTYIGDDDDDAAVDEEGNSSSVVDLEDIGSVMSSAEKAAAAAATATQPREMVTPLQRKALTKEGYKIIGTHSAVKLCRWTKAQLRSVTTTYYCYVKTAHCSDCSEHIA
jgi:hypothetical protein